MSLKTLIEKAKTGNQIRNLVGCQWNEKEVKAGNSKWVSVEDLKTFLDDYVVVPRKQLSELTEGLILGQPAIFPYIETEFDKGYTKGYYGAKEQVEEKLKELLEGSI